MNILSGGAKELQVQPCTVISGGWSSSAGRRHKQDLATVYAHTHKIETLKGPLLIPVRRYSWSRGDVRTETQFSVKRRPWRTTSHPPKHDITCRERQSSVSPVL